MTLTYFLGSNGAILDFLFPDDKLGLTILDMLLHVIETLVGLGCW